MSTSSQDGSSFDQAIAVSRVEEEYAWLAKTHPGATVLTQMLVHRHDRHYDVLTLALASGESQQMFFEVPGFTPKARAI